MTTKINFWTEVKNRWKADSPIFFVKLQRFGNWLSATGATIAALGYVDLLGVPGLVTNIAAVFAISGALITAISKLTVKDPDYSKLSEKR